MNSIKMQNNRRKLQQQILLKYKLKQMIRMQNQLNIQNAQQQNAQQQNAQLQNAQQQNALETFNEVIVNEPILNDLETVNEDVVEVPLIDYNSEKLAVIKSKIMTDYSNLYKTK